MITVNGVELDFNLYDYDTALKYENALHEVTHAKPQSKNLSSVIREQCEVVFAFFDSVFGEGTAEKVFQGRYDFKNCTEAFGEVVRAAKAQVKEYDDLLSKYVPNRASRRASK